MNVTVVGSSRNLASHRPRSGPVSSFSAVSRSDRGARSAAWSADGRYLAFGSYAENLAPVTDPYDPCDLNLCPSGFSYVKDLVTGRVVNVTVGMEDALADDWDQIEPSISAR